MHLLQLWTSFVHAFVDVLHAGGPAAPRPAHAAPHAPAPPPEPPLVLPAVPRLVAIGDLHGDLAKARRAFRLAGLVDEQDNWAGGTTTAVQVGGSGVARGRAAAGSRGKRDCLFAPLLLLSIPLSPCLPARQVGDVLDRGDHELALLYWLERLRRQVCVCA